jgi:HAD superfamily hydrolase (TIGR01490 family)
MRLVLVDLDGTLLKGGSEARFILHLLASRRIGAAALARSLIFAIRHANRSGRHVWKKNKAYLAGLPAAEVDALARAFAFERLSPLLRGSLRERIAGHHAAGDHVILLTGSPDFLARPVAEAVGAHGWLATACAEKDGLYLAAPPLCHPFGREKLVLARAAAERLGLAMADCVAYADTGEDIELLSAVGAAVAVAPDGKLARRARAEGWEVLTDSRLRLRRRMLAALGQRA